MSSSKHQDYLAQYYGESSQTVSDFEPSKPKKKKSAKAAVKPMQGFKLIDETIQTHEYEDFTSGIPQKKSNAFIDYSADTKRKELEGQAQHHMTRDSDSSPPRRGRPSQSSSTASHSTHLSESHRDSGDISPPRRNKRETNSSSPPRSRSGGSDLSPPRNSRMDDDKTETTGDLSPPRRHGQHGDNSPPRRSHRHSPPSSPPRSMTSAAEDSSPPRRVKQELEEDQYSDFVEKPSSESHAPMHTGGGFTMMNGERAGLQTGAEITAEARRRREKEISRIATSVGEYDDEAHAQTVYRDEYGRKIVVPVEEEAIEEKKVFRSTAARRAHEEQEQRSESSRGHRGRAEEDERRDQKQQERTRWDDPWARLKASGAVDDDDDDFEDPMRKHKKRKRDQSQKKTKSKTWDAFFPPNRFNLRPGALWDGVDRSNGFEMKAYRAQLDKAHMAEQAYRFTSSDM